MEFPFVNPAVIGLSNGEIVTQSNQKGPFSIVCKQRNGF